MISATTMAHNVNSPAAALTAARPCTLCCPATLLLPCCQCMKHTLAACCCLAILILQLLLLFLQFIMHCRARYDLCSCFIFMLSASCCNTFGPFGCVMTVEWLPNAAETAVRVRDQVRAAVKSGGRVKA